MASKQRLVMAGQLSALRTRAERLLLILAACLLVSLAACQRSAAKTTQYVGQLRCVPSAVPPRLGPTAAVGSLPLTMVLQGGTRP